MNKLYSSSLVILAILLNTGCVSQDDQPFASSPERAEQALLKCEAKAQASYEAQGPAAAEAVWQTKVCDTAKNIVEQNWQQQRDIKLNRNQLQQDDIFASMHWTEFFYKRQQCGYQQQANKRFCSAYPQWQDKMQNAYQKDLLASDFDLLISRVEKFCSTKHYNEISCAIWRTALADKKQLAYNRYLTDQQQLQADFYSCKSRFSQLRQVAAKHKNKQKLLSFQFYSLPCSLVLQAASKTQLAYTFY
ncbi:hypothetical protein [Spartinivicinus ruber]|uniref:hypothetical protein n=1 Tax=Spartinivicinus ruber TaxID=2683272 RepID=UPI0013D3F7B6|nr:hypothetical protein [Spartinivicinus ruber]